MCYPKRRQTKGVRRCYLIIPTILCMGEFPTMSSQAWFWTAEVQQAVAASARELDAGDSEVYSSGAEFLVSLADPEA